MRCLKTARNIRRTGSSRSFSNLMDRNLKLFPLTTQICLIFVKNSRYVDDIVWRQARDHSQFHDN